MNYMGITLEDGTTLNLGDKIDGTHFIWAEALRQGNTGSYATPTADQRANILKQAHLLEPVRELLGPLRVTSWLRTPAHNASVGGANHSAHLCGAATDFIPVNVEVEEAKKMIQDAGVYPGGGELNSNGWVHLDFIHQKWFMA